MAEGGGLRGRRLRGEKRRMKGGGGKGFNQSINYSKF